VAARNIILVGESVKPIPQILVCTVASQLTARNSTRVDDWLARIS